MTDQITVSRELLRQAIDALNLWINAVTYTDRIKALNPTNDAITALREALEQPVQPAVEPVAWRWAYKGEPDSDKCFPMPVPDQDVQDVAKMRAFPRTVQLLYAAPPAQQPQLLTEEELADLDWEASPSLKVALMSFARVIETAVLKKNGVVK